MTDPFTMLRRCSLLLALFLALCKRRHELVALTGAEGVTRPSLSQYDEGLLNALIPMTGAATLVSYSVYTCLLYTSPSPRDRTRSRMPSSA